MDQQGYFLEMQRHHSDDLLFSLPDSLSFEVANAWLRLRDVVNVDSAFCSRLRRPHLLNNVFRSPRYTIAGLSSTRSAHLASDFIAWASRRGIGMRSLLVTEDVDRMVCRLYLQKFGNSIKRAVMRNISLPLRAPSDVLCMVAMYCTSINSLVCEYCMISDALVDVLHSCKELKSIRFEGCDEDAWTIESDMNSLQGLTFSKMKNIEIDSFHGSNMAHAATATLMLNDPAAVHRLSIKHAAPAAFHQFTHRIESYSRLRALSLSQMSSVTDTSLALIVNACPRIVHLNISGCRGLTNPSTVLIAQGLTQLRSISIQFSGLGNGMLRALAEHRVDTLEVLHCCNDNVTSTAFSMVLLRCTKLHNISLSNTDARMLVGNMELLGNITTLYLDFHVSHPHNIFTLVIQHCKKLQTIYLSYVASWCQLPFLKLVDLPDLRLLSVWRDTHDQDDEHYTGVTDYVRAPAGYDDVKLIGELKVLCPELKVRYEQQELSFDVMKLKL